MQILCHGLKEEDFPVEFIGHKIFLGYADTNSIVVKAEGVSRYHAFLIEEGDELFLQDNDSLNGTFINCEQIFGKRKLSPGDVVQIGFRLIKVDFLPGGQVLFDFVSPDQIEVVSTESEAADGSETPDGSEAGNDEPVPAPPSAGDEIGRTMVAAETQAPAPSPVPPPPVPPPASSENALFSGGTEIGKYVIIKRIGKGGMGEVYLARHKTLGISRALKILPKELMVDNRKFFDRFIQEAKLASEIRHPNIVGVMDVETDSECGYPYIVMEYIDGGSLRNSLAENYRLSEEQAVVIVEAIAAALIVAEEHNIVHRDIKPDNIMFTRVGEVKLADLGIAKKGDAGIELTKTNMMIGTPAYLPPEQARNAKSVDGRADIYSLGATFYEMLTGEQPYPGENTIEVLHKLFSDPVPDPRKVNPEVSAASAAIVMKMMAKNPKDRFRNAGELLDMMSRTFPPHTAYEAGEVIKKVIAGDCQNSTEFTSSISSSHLFLWWFELRNKKLAVAAILLFIACFVLGVLSLFLGEPSAADPLSGEQKPDEPEAAAPVVEKYDLQITTTPYSDIQFIAPDGKMSVHYTGSKGFLSFSGLPAGQYRINVSRNDCIPATRDIDLNSNMLVDVQLEIDSSSEVVPAQRDKANTGTGDKPSASGSQSQSTVRPANDSETGSGSARRQSSEPGIRGPVVTTDLDILDEKDDRMSFPKAVRSVNDSGSGATVTFAKDFSIRLRNPLPVISKGLIIDGGKNMVTIRGMDKEPLFRLSSGELTLKNLTLVSNFDTLGDIRYGGIFDGKLMSSRSTARVDLFSVQDGGSSDCLWVLAGRVDMTMDGSCRLHRLAGSKGASVTIMSKSVLINATLNGESVESRPGSRRTETDAPRFNVYGHLQNATVKDYSDVYVFAGATCENLTAKAGSLVEQYAGTINGLKLEYGAVYGYAKGAVLRGKVSIGGIMKEARRNVPTNVPIVGDDTEVEFDLTKRSGGFDFAYRTNMQTYAFSRNQSPPMIDNMMAFLGARSYAILLNDIPAPGTYRLAGGADDFHSPVSLVFNNRSYPGVLRPGKSFSRNNRSYSLLLNRDPDTRETMLILTIRNLSVQ